jgi:hypothetical protein
MQVNFASNRKIFVFLFCVFVNNYIWFWIPVRALVSIRKYYIFFTLGKFEGLLEKVEELNRQQQDLDSETSDDILDLMREPDVANQHLMGSF